MNNTILQNGQISRNGFQGISEEEIAAAGHCLESALAGGAAQARVTVSKNILDSIQLLNGEIDKVSRNADRALSIHLFVDGRYGTYSTNRFSFDSIDEFILKAISRTRMLTPDKCRHLPSPELYARNAVSGRELGLYDRHYECISPEDRVKAAMSGTVYGSDRISSRHTLISEECEYSDSVDDCYIIDSQGFTGRHTETSFSFWSEITIQDRNGDRYSGYWWSSAPAYDRLMIYGCSETALSRAEAQVGATGHSGGKFTMVVDSTCSSRLAAPLLNALYGSAIQQRNSFLDGTLNRKIFPDELTVRDMAWSKGETGSRLFDPEGIATRETDIIRNGTVEMYFINTYFSDKLGMPATVNGPSRPVILPFNRYTAGNGLDYKENGINLQAILESAGNGILVTGFNGGNCNSTTGNFSYGVEGFAFRDGKITHPVREMLITGNMVSLWQSIMAAGSDAREGARWQIPSLAFGNVDFTGE